MSNDAIDIALKESLTATQLADSLGHVTSTLGVAAFAHAFALFNDALAARVPFLAGVIHATPDLFLIPALTEPLFCRRRNAQIAAYAMYAANDEYSLGDGGENIHQRMSQHFLESVLDYCHDRS